MAAGVDVANTARGDGCIVHTSRIVAPYPTHGTGATKPIGDMATKLIDM